MFIHGKPIRFGYKNWVLESSDSCPYKFGFIPERDTKDSSKPLGPQVVFALLSIVENSACLCVYFDNFFTSYYLLRYLHEKNFRDLGTICEGCTMKCPL